MNKYLPALVIFLVPVFVHAEHVRSVPLGGGRSNPGETGPSSPAGAPQPPVVVKMRRQSVPRPEHIPHSRDVIRDRQSMSVPQRDERGTRIVKSEAVYPPRHT